MSTPLSPEDFSSVVRKTNLFGVDLIIEDDAGRILLGLRSNRPAKGFWFVPGGRVLKNEPVASAMGRILRRETGLDVSDMTRISFHGLYDHIYDDNLFEDPTFNTHYIVAACRMKLAGARSFIQDSQHECLKFIAVGDLLLDPLVHTFVKYYFTEEAPNRFL